MIHHKTIPKTVLIISITSLLISVMLFVAAYSLNKRLGLKSATLMRDILVEFIGKFGGNLITVGLILALIGTTGIISWKKWLR